MGTHCDQTPGSLLSKTEVCMLVEGKPNELVAKEKKRWQKGPKGTVMEMNVHPVKHFGEPNEERTGDDWMQDKQALFFSGCCVLSCLAKSFWQHPSYFSVHLKRTVWRFGKYILLLPCQEVREENDAALV